MSRPPRRKWLDVVDHMHPFFVSRGEWLEWYDEKGRSIEEYGEDMAVVAMLKAMI